MTAALKKLNAAALNATTQYRTHRAYGADNDTKIIDGD